MSVFIGFMLVVAFIAYAGYELYGSKIKSTIKTFMPLLRVAGVGAGVIVLLYLYFSNASLFYTIMESVVPAPMHRAMALVSSAGSGTSPGVGLADPVGSQSRDMFEQRFPHLNQPSFSGTGMPTRLSPLDPMTTDVTATSTTTSTSKPDARAKRSVSAAMKKRIAANQKWHCAICREMLNETYEVDHELALYMGGTNDESNLRALCRSCHAKKSADERMSNPPSRM